MHLARHRLVALVAACALAVSAAVYAAHGLADRNHEHTHCDLCVHLSGTAGSAALVAVVGKPLLMLTAVRVLAGVRLVAADPRGAHSSRGPPLLFLLR
jgi:hypothetical protein